MKNGKLRVALVGVSFGAEFIPIYLKHPDVDSLVLVDTNEKLLNTVGDKFLLEERLTDFNAMLEDKTIDAVHLVTPPATHAPLSIQVMNAGKHCACTIPMGMSIDELYQVIDARKRSGKHCAHCEDNGCCACYGIAAGINALSCGLVCFLVDNQTALTICFQTLCGAANQGGSGRCRET